MKIQNLFKKSSKKTILTAAFITANFYGLFAQAAGGGIDAKIDTWKTSVDSALDAAIALFAVVGGFLVFFQYMQGNEQAQKNLIRLVIGVGVFAIAKLLVGVLI